MINGVPQLEDLGDVSGKRVLVRCDFNVPIRDGQITDDLRIRAALPTLRWLQDQGATVTACSHLGRPKGAPDPQFSMDPVRARLAELASVAEAPADQRVGVLHQRAGVDPARVDLRDRPIERDRSDVDGQLVVADVVGRSEAELAARVRAPAVGLAAREQGADVRVAGRDRDRGLG